MFGLVCARIWKAMLVLALAMVASTVVERPAHADPQGEIYTEYYDCALNIVGWKFRGCGACGGCAGTGFQWGQLSGAWRFIQTEPCDNGGEFSARWWRWTGSGWVWEMGGPYCTCC